MQLHYNSITVYLSLTFVHHEVYGVAPVWPAAVEIAWLRFDPHLHAVLRTRRHIWLHHERLILAFIRPILRRNQIKSFHQFKDPSYTFGVSIDIGSSQRVQNWCTVKQMKLQAAGAAVFDANTHISFPKELSLSLWNRHYMHRGRIS